MDLIVYTNTNTYKRYVAEGVKSNGISQPHINLQISPDEIYAAKMFPTPLPFKIFTVHEYFYESIFLKPRLS